MDIFTYLLDALVLVALVLALMFSTAAIKAKENPGLKKTQLLKAVAAFIAYALLNLLRLYLEGKLF